MGKEKQLSNSFSTGGGGSHFEAHVQASFVVLMLTGGQAPCLPNWPIKEIHLQGKHSGFHTDDIVVFVDNDEDKERRKILGQIKHSIAITKRDTSFAEVLNCAWKDFNNPDNFKKSKDIIALITGPLNATDFHNVNWLLNQSRHTKNADDFFRNVKQAKFSPSKSIEKLEVFQKHLRSANSGRFVSRDDLYQFLKHFHILGYDLGKEVGVVLSLLHSHISQFNQRYSHWIWPRIVDIVQTWNQDGGVITIDNLPDDIINEFEQPSVVRISKELEVERPKLPEADWGLLRYKEELALFNCIGKWIEKNDNDVIIVEEILGKEYEQLITEAREMLHDEVSSIRFRNGLWYVQERRSLCYTIGSRIFDSQLDKLKECAIEVLSEIDPKFELDTEERHLANVKGEVLKYSKDLRQGLAETLALLGNHGDALKNCSQGKPRITALLCIRELFEMTTWQRWASLNDLLPTLAEAAPEELLRCVEKGLDAEQMPLDELFKQEGKGFFGSNYMTGLLWALESLAWDEKHLSRVAVILAELADRDPDGKWTNRPDNSLITILMPWFPQTLAPAEKRVAAMKGVKNDFPNVTWKILINLLPGQRQMSSGSHKPQWYMSLPKDWKPEILRQEYRDQVVAYSEMAVDMARHDVDKLIELVDHLDNLPKESFEKTLEYLDSQAIKTLSDEERLPICDKLLDIPAKHRRFSDKQWALKEDTIVNLERVAGNIAPKDLDVYLRRLFVWRDIDLYESREDREEEDRKIESKRKDAIKKILDVNGLYGLLDFTGKVEAPVKVGATLAEIQDNSFDSQILPHYLDADSEAKVAMTKNYVWNRFRMEGWKWVDNLNRQNWTTGQNCQFLFSLPFDNETWIRVEEWLGNKEGSYWQDIKVVPYQSKQDPLPSADKLIAASRPNAALECLNTRIHREFPLDNERTIKALMAAMSSKETIDNLDVHAVTELIKALRDDSKTNPDDMMTIEWAYLRLLDRYHDAEPKYLEAKLATEPNFFCEVIRMVYKSKNADDKSDDIDEEKQAIASNAWHLLHFWQRPPGLKDDNSFSENEFRDWLEKVKEQCKESGHLEVAMLTIGEVLFYSPPDPGGLWIVKAVAKALNAKDSKKMRDGFTTEVYNSRGAHTVDPEGKPEKELGEKWRARASDVEDKGFARFAVALRELADSYDREAERLIEEHKNEMREIEEEYQARFGE